MQRRALSARLGAGMSLGTRALVAVLLTVAFYVFAIGLGLALVVVVPLLVATRHWASIWLGAATAGAGITILRAIVPLRSSFKPPGPEVTAAKQPELYALLDQVAR